MSSTPDPTVLGPDLLTEQDAHYPTTGSEPEPADYLSDLVSPSEQVLIGQPGHLPEQSGRQGLPSAGEAPEPAGIRVVLQPESGLKSLGSPASPLAPVALAMDIAAEPDFPLGANPEPAAPRAVQLSAGQQEDQETLSPFASLRSEETTAAEGAELTAAVIPDRRPTPTEAAALRASSAALSNLSLPARLEAILYLKGRPLGLAELAEIAGIDRDQAEMALITLMTDYAHRDTALEIRQEGQRYSLQLRDSLGDLVQSLLPVDLSTAALRTLATIALKKRILQSELVELRGSGAYDHIKELLAQEFIERRRQSEGRSYWLSLSEKFHRTFSVSADELGQRRRQAA